MRAHEIVTAAAELVNGERRRTHGDKVLNHENIAALWNAYLTIRREPAAPLEAVDVALMMALLKIARTQHGDFNLDNFIDLAGYAGVAGEIVERDIKD